MKNSGKSLKIFVVFWAGSFHFPLVCRFLKAKNGNRKEIEGKSKEHEGNEGK